MLYNPVGCKLKAVDDFRHHKKNYLVLSCLDKRTKESWDSNLPGHPMSVTQHYLAMNEVHFNWVNICIIFK